jgi:hypothetical protein
MRVKTTIEIKIIKLIKIKALTLNNFLLNLEKTVKKIIHSGNL